MSPARSKARRRPSVRGPRASRAAWLVLIAAVAGTPQAAAEDHRHAWNLLMSRAEPFRPLIESAAERHGVDPLLVEALAGIESAFDPEAVSSVGAIGLMQVMPATAAQVDCHDPYDPASNIEAGTRWLARLLDLFGGDQRLAIAAYNAGEGAVQRAGGIPPYPETRRHVAKVLRYLSLRNGEPVKMEPDMQRFAAEAPIFVSPQGRVRLPAAPPQTITARRDASGRLVFTNVGARE